MHAQIEPVYHSRDVPLRTGFEVRLARGNEEARLLATLTSAFINDPPGRWHYPQPHDYLRYFPAFARAFGGGAMALGSAWRTDDFSAGACWFPPETAPDETSIIAVIEDSISARRHAEVLAVFAALGQAHPDAPHWYLPLIGVDAACQGQGRGTALLRATLAVCDRDGFPAYLEASNPRSIPLYERFGFRRRASLRVGSCPPITPMWRDATASRSHKKPRQYSAKDARNANL
jgi:ribosomal protein S18 acetylase RimI-like enzyme